jgi:squalene-hopene/tetraprenyl-beta-curcumene cyclase
MKWRSSIAIAVTILIVIGFNGLPVSAADPSPQYELGDFTIPAATAEEPKRDSVSVPLALDYLEKGTQAWNGQKKCVTCHTNGIYMTIRPALSDTFGKPTESVRQFFVETLDRLEGLELKKLLQATQPAQVIYTAAGLAEWDKHVTKQLSPETERALTLMFSIQRESGTWGTLDCWPPYESDAFHEATMAAMAVAAAPGWLAKIADTAVATRVAQLMQYLRTEIPPHDYGRVLLLWASSRIPDLIDQERKSELLELIFKHQRDDGGWSIRTFADPDAWGNGNRAARLNAEPELGNPPSDGHQTGLAIVVLREAGVEAKDPRIQKAVAWLKSNQRASGRWWTKSLNTDSWHYITYSGTAFPVLALSLCDAIPVETVTSLTDPRSLPRQ